MAMIRNAGDGMLFREDFWNATMVERNDGLEVGAPVISDGLSGGQVAWYGKAHTYAFDRDISIVVECISVASGSNQALLSIGTLAARRIEFGIDALGQPYAWGTAQVNLGLPVDDGPHVFGFSVDTYGNVTCVVDGVLWGTGTVVFGPLTTRMLAGGSCVGGLAWGATVRPIRIYGYAADYATLVSLCGLPASAVWTPDLMLVGRDGLYEDLDGAGGVTTHTQTPFPDLDMELAGIANFSAIGVCTISKDNAVFHGGTQSLKTEIAVTAAGTGVRFDNVKIVGCRYVDSIWHTGGAFQLAFAGASAPIGAVGVWTNVIAEATSDNVSRPYANYGSPTTFWLDSYACKNLSINAINCKGNLGNLSQATPASMTWSSDPQAPTSTPRNGRRLNYSDGVADHNVSTLAAADWPLHQAPGFTYCEVITVAAAAAGNDTLIDNCNRSALSHGINANYDVTNKKLVVSVANGSGTFVVSEGMTVAPGKTITVDATWTAVDGLEVSVNGAPPMVQPTPPLDKAIFFNGINQRVSMGNVLGFEWNQPFSISVLFRGTTPAGTIYSKATSGASIKGVNLVLSSSGRISFELHGSSTRQVILNSAPIVTDGNIHHIVATYDGSGSPAGMSIYVDNVEGYSQTVVNTLAGLTILNATHLYLGVRDASFVSLTGQEGDVVVFNKKLSLAEVAEIYNDGRPVDMLATSLAQNLYAWWKMGEGDTFPTITDVRHGASPSALYPTILDLSGSGFHGTMTNMATNNIVLDSSGGNFSKMSLDFDGSNDFVNMGNVLNFERTDPVTFSFHVKTTSVSDYLLSKMDATVNYRGYGVYMTATGQVNVFFVNVDATSKIKVLSAGSVNNGVWRHVVVTYDGSSTAAGVTITIDDVPQVLTTEQDDLSGTIITTASFNVSGRTNGSLCLSGKIDDVCVYNTVLTPAERTEIYNGGVPTDNRLLSSAPSLVGYWRMGDDVRFDGTMVSMTAANIVDMGPSAAAASATLQDGRTSGNADFFQGSRADKIVLVGKATAGELSLWRQYAAAKYAVDTRAKATQFLGGTRHTRHGNVLGYERTNQFSVGFWIKLTGNTGYVCAKADANRGWGIGNDNGQLFFSLYAPGAELRVRSTTDLRAAGWQFVTFTYDGSSLAAGVTLYLNGVVSGSTVISDTIGANTIINAAEFNIGGRTNGSVILDNAVLDEIDIWGKVLTPAEVAEIHNGGLPVNFRALSIPPKVLFGWWRMGDSDVFPTLLDSAEYGNYNGTMTNMAETDIIDRT